MKISFRQLFFISFFPLFISILFIPQSIFATIIHYDKTSSLLFLIIFFSILFYSIGATFSFFISKKKIIVISPFQTKLLLFIYFVYIVVYMSLIVFSDNIPIVSVLSGGNSGELRSSFYKNKTGIALILVYLRSILVRGFLPLILLIFYKQMNKKYFYLLIAIFILLSIISLEKSLFLWGVLPIIIYTFSVFDLSSFFKWLIVSFALIAVLTVITRAHFTGQLSMGGIGCYYVAGANSQIDGMVEIGNVEIQLASLVSVPNRQFILYDLDEGTSLSYIFNRIFWVPYITAYDTLLYWHNEYSSEFIYSSINRHLSHMFDENFADLEREVFRFQYGSGTDSTGNANAAYFVEMYLGFGFLGVFISSFLIGAIYGWIVRSDNLIVMSVSLVYAKGLANASFVSMLFSGGFIFFLIMSFFMLRTNRENINSCCC